MINFVKLARQLPNALVVAAIFDFVLNLMSFWSYWMQNQYYTSATDGDSYWIVSIGLAQHGIGLILYPLGWIVSATMLHLLLAIYDGKVAENA